jgi:hypothetical protein
MTQRKKTLPTAKKVFANFGYKNYSEIFLTKY